MPLPTHTFNKTSIKVRYRERYASQAVNRKFLGYPFGVYYGFTPTAASGSLVLRLEPDASSGTSIARVQSSAELCSVDVVVEDTVELDFSAHDFGAEPTAYVMVRASASIGGATSGEVFTRATGPSDLTEQLLCVVTKPAADLVIAADPSAGPAVERDTPYAYAGAPLGYGFMASGAVEQLQDAVLTVGEVAAARDDLDGVYHDWDPLDASPPPGIELGLADRISADLLPTAIASRLGLVYRVVRSNEHTTTTDTSEVNVSSSFTVTARTRLPMITFVSGGSETQVGAVTGGDVEGRNVCFVTKDGTNSRPVDNERRVVFGRLTYAEKAITGTLTFSAVSPFVLGAGTDFTDPTQVQVGDILFAPDGLYYTVINVSDPALLELDQIPSSGGLSIGPMRRRWLLKLYTRSSLGEAPYTIATATTFRFFFGAWFSIGSSVYDATLEMFEGGEETPLPNAAPGVEGKVQMYPGLTDAKAGAIQNIQIRGAAVGTGVPVFSLGFDGAYDQTGGVANITMAGETGDQGDPGTGSGPPGVPGVNGTGFDNYSEIFHAQDFPDPPDDTLLTHSYTFPSTLKYLHGGIRQFNRAAQFPYIEPFFTLWVIGEYFDLTSVYRTGGSNNIGVITDTVHSNHLNHGLFLNGAG